jgi:hypothetical protein
VPSVAPANGGARLVLNHRNLAADICNTTAKLFAPHPTALHPRLDSPQPGALYTMLSRSTACRGAQRAARQQSLSQPHRRGLAAPASGSFQYQTGEAKGVKFASRDFAGPTTTLALVAKAGTRFQPLPGLTEGLANFAFRVRRRQTAAHLLRELR